MRSRGQLPLALTYADVGVSPGSLVFASKHKVSAAWTIKDIEKRKEKACAHPKPL